MFQKHLKKTSEVEIRFLLNGDGKRKSTFEGKAPGLKSTGNSLMNKSYQRTSKPSSEVGLLWKALLKGNKDVSL